MQEFPMKNTRTLTHTLKHRYTTGTQNTKETVKQVIAY